MADLKGLIKAQILDTVVKGVKTASGWKVLIVDDDALRMISACCRMYDLTDNGVVIVEDINKKRQPMLDVEAVYLCNPNSINAQLIKEDFTPKHKYKAAHIFFIDAADDAVIAQLAHPALKEVTRTISELNMNFVPRESGVFTLDMPDGLHEYYSPRSKNNRANLVAAKIASVCAALGEIPVVRYSAQSPECEGLARQVQERIDMLAKFDDGMTRKKSQLLIMDRGEDMAAPLVHELSYQCAVYDFLEDKMEGDIYTHTFTDGGGKTRQKRLVIGDNDEVWDEFRHTHIAEVGEKVAKRFKEFQAESEAAVVTGDTSTPEGKQKALKAMMQAAPQRKEMTERFSVHLSLAAAITSGNGSDKAAFDKFAESCVQAEQNILTGVDGQGKKVKSAVGELGSFISERGSSAAKLRALGVCVVAAGGLPDGELNRLYDLAEISFKGRKAVKNMEVFGIPVALNSRSKAAKPRSRLEGAGNPNLTQYFTSRWTPVVKDFMIGAVTGTLDTRAFPPVKGMPSAMVEAGSGGEEIASARKGRRNWAKNRNKGEEDSAASATPRKDRNRLIVFIPGAIGYNEIRCAYEMSKQYDVDVYIGSHTVCTPNQFVNKLQLMDEDLDAASAPLSGVADAIEAGEALQVVRGQSAPKASNSVHGI